MQFKILSIILLSSLFLNASAYDLKKIKRDFHKNVVVNSHVKNRDKMFKLSKSYFDKAVQHLLFEQDKFKHTQFVTLIDLSKQILMLTIWDECKRDFFLVGFDFISAGDMDREVFVKKGEDHYVKTPTGLFDIKSGWRSDGKKYDYNSVKPYGKKGRFIFFFGTQKSVRYNSFDKNGSKIQNKKNYKLIKDKLEFAMHAHLGAENFGYPQSHGCIRMSGSLNEFLDNNFVFFAHLLDDKKWNHPYETPPKNPKNRALAGKYVMIIDSVF